MAKRTLNMPKPKEGGGGFTDRFIVQNGKNVLRVYPLEHEEERYLAVPDVVVHFEGGEGAPVACLGKECPMCAEAKRSKNRRLRAVVRYPMAVHPVGADIDEGDPRVLKYDAPASVYKSIYSLVEENGDDILGNDGMDIIVNYDPSKDFAAKYNVTIKARGSSELDIEDSEIPDLISEWERDKSSATLTDTTKEVEEEEEMEDEVVFKDSRGKKHTGVWTGTMQKGKYVIEADGQTYTVKPEKIISGIDSEEEEEADGPKVGETYQYEDDDGSFEVEVVEVDGDTATVSCDGYDDFEVNTSDLTPIVGEEEEEEAEEEEPEEEEEGPVVGGTYTYTDEDVGDIEVTVESIKNGVATVSCEEYEDFKVELGELK